MLHIYKKYVNYEDVNSRICRKVRVNYSMRNYFNSNVIVVLFFTLIFLRS